MSKPLDQLMQKQMTRAEFLATLGLGVLAIFGFGRIVELLTGKSIHHKITQNIGYDGGTYGGTKTQPATKRAA